MVGESLGCKRGTKECYPNCYTHNNKNKDPRGKREVNFFTINISFVGSYFPSFKESIFQNLHMYS